MVDQEAVSSALLLTVDVPGVDLDCVARVAVLHLILFEVIEPPFGDKEHSGLISIL